MKKSFYKVLMNLIIHLKYVSKKLINYVVQSRWSINMKGKNSIMQNCKLHKALDEVEGVVSTGEKSIMVQGQGERR